MNNMNNTVEEIRKHMVAIAKLLEIPETQSNSETPCRVAKMWANELFRNRNNYNIQELNSSMKLFPSEDGFPEVSEPITVTDIEVWSVCEHHWLPFMCNVEVSYTPDENIIGLSKIPRVVKYFAKRPQLQERLTKDIGDYLVKFICPQNLRVRIKAVHQCVMCRGVEENCSTITTYTYNRDDSE